MDHPTLGFCEGRDWIPGFIPGVQFSARQMSKPPISPLHFNFETGLSKLSVASSGLGCDNDIKAAAIFSLVFHFRLEQPMPTLFARLAEWWAFTMTYDALRRLDPALKSDLGLGEADLRRLARRAMKAKGPISIYQLVNEETGDGEPPERSCSGASFTAPISGVPARHGAR